MKNYSVFKIINLDYECCYYGVCYGVNKGLLQHYKTKDDLEKLYKKSELVALQTLNICDNKEDALKLCKEFIDRDKRCLNKGNISIYDTNQLKVKEKKPITVEEIKVIDQVKDDDKKKYLGEYERTAKRRQYKREYYLKNREKILAQQKEKPRTKDRDKAREYNRRYLLKNKEKIYANNRKWYHNNKETQAVKRNAYYHANKEKLYANRDKEKMRDTHKKWMERHVDEVKAYQKKYYENNKERHAEWSRNYYYRVTKLKRANI